MLAAKVKDVNAIKYPVLASRKIDGIRCLVIDGKALTRSFLPVPNVHIRRWLETLPMPLDGELMLHEGATFQDITSAVMSREAQPPFWTYHIFDCLEDLKLGFKRRFERLRAWYINEGAEYPFIRLVPHHIIKTPEALLRMEKICLAAGHEGVMIRSLTGRYKFNRSTWREGGLLKLKRFQDAEARVIGFEEQYHNANEATVSELGLTKRSSSKAGKIPAGTLGKLIVRGIGKHFEGKKFSIGVMEGVDQAQRLHIWNNREQYYDKIVRYRFQVQGVKDLPRIPIFTGWRDERDL